MDELINYIKSQKASNIELKKKCLEKHGYALPSIPYLESRIETMKEESQKLYSKIRLIDYESRIERACKSEAISLKGYMQAQLEGNGGVCYHIEDDIKFYHGEVEDFKKEEQKKRKRSS
jgi:hypothetical protein